MDASETSASMKHLFCFLPLFFSHQMHSLYIQANTLNHWSSFQLKYEVALKHKDKIKIVTPDWVSDSIEKREKQDETIYHPRLVFIPKPPSPLKPEPEPMEVSSPATVEMQHLQLPSSMTERRPSTESNESGGSRPDTPSAKEALARLVTNRIHVQKGPNSHSPKSPVTPQFPGIPPNLQQMSPAPQGIGPGFPAHELPKPIQGPSTPGRSTLRNITNTEPAHQKSSPYTKPGSNKKTNQLLGLQGQAPRQPPPPYNSPQIGSTFPLAQQQPETPAPPVYCGHDQSDSVPPDICLLGCVFYITDYQKIVGPEQIAIWKQVIEQYGGQVDQSYSNRVTHLLCANQHSDVFQLALKDQRRVVTAFWLNDVLLRKKMLPPWQSLHIPLIYGEEKPCSNQVISVTNFENDERTRVKQMIHAIGARYTGYMTRSNTALVCKKPEGVKYQKAKEWRIAVVNVQWLSDMVLGYTDALRLPVNRRYLQVGHGDEFQMDLTKIPHLIYAWKTPLKITKDAWKRYMPNLKSRPHNLGKDHHPSAAKKPRMDEIKENKGSGPHVLFTGFPRGLTKHLQMIVTSLGGTVVENPRNCSHLVAPGISRTMKFFVAINVCHYVMDKQWLENSMQQNRFIDETNYLLRDPKSEADINCSMVRSLAKARQHPLFQGLTFYFTPGVTPPPCDLRIIVESAGGTVARKRRLGVKTIASQKDEKGNPTYLVITCAEDIQLCKDLILNKIAIYNPELILTGVLRQELDFTQFQLEIQ
ncbi:hypothetical protein CHS0354_031786 [Potamilus streckersoni]|uniref:PAX-interacting protein 1 n=1 Tax=Potamilus streckersoni TaxID=2493646 RepID=A0AAE0VLP3_9BIVA|nr:hypothetical protein CHS0354_031786 [Potamilus streckersoni]